MLVDYEKISHDRINEHETAAKAYENLANNIFIDLTKQLIILGSGLLALFSFFIANNKDILGLRLKLSLFIALLFIFLSIISGIIQLIVERAFYLYIVNFYSNLRLIFLNCRTKKAYFEAIETQNIETGIKFKEDSNLIPFYLQITFFILTILIIMIIYGVLLLK